MKTVVLTCFICNKNFERRFKQFKYESKNKENYHVLCSNECRKKFRSTKKIVNCSLCLKEIIKKPSSIRENNFCNNVCSAIYSNKNRCVDKKRTKTIKCAECNIDATIQINKKNICKLCENKKKEIKKKNKNILDEIPKKCIRCLNIDTYKKQKYCQDCRSTKASIDAINRVTSDKNASKLKSIICNYNFNGNQIRCDSKAEYSCLNFIEINYPIKLIYRCPIILKYNLDGKIRRYNPDFEIILKDGSKMIVECKTVLSSKDLQRKWSIYYKSIIPKKEVLEIYCKENNIKYLSYNKDMHSKYYRNLSREFLQNIKVQSISDVSTTV